LTAGAAVGTTLATEDDADDLAAAVGGIAVGATVGVAHATIIALTTSTSNPVIIRARA
jgi:hypothetical protein